MKKAIIYFRVSSEGQAENTSIQDQKDKIKNYCKTYDIEIIKEFEDISTGGNTDRKGYLQMKELIQEQQVELIVVYKLDRLHRSLKNLIIDKEELEKQGINIISVMEQMDTSTPQGKLFFNMIGSFSEFEKDIINQRCSQGKKAKISTGRFTAGKIPLGYRIEKSEYIVIHTEEAERVKKAFQLRANGKALRPIEKEVKIPKSTLSYIFKNTAYIGKLEQEKGHTIKIPRIISTQLFNRVNSKPK